MEGEGKRREDQKEEEARKVCSTDQKKSNGVEDIVPAIASIQIAPEDDLDKDRIVTENSDTGEGNQTTLAIEDSSTTLFIPTVVEFAGEENNTSPAAPKRKSNGRLIKQTRTANKENTTTVAIVTGVSNADPPKADVNINQQSELPAEESEVVTAEPDMEVDFMTTEISVTCQTDFFQPRLMEVVEEQPAQAIDSPCVQRAVAEPWLEVTSPPQETQPLPPPAPRTHDEYFARPGPSWAEPSDLDYLQWSRPQHPVPGRHNLGGDVSIASELALQSGRRQHYYRNRREYQGSSRHNPYDTMTRDSTRTTALRNSRFARCQTRGDEYSSQSTSLAHLGLYPTHQYPAPEPVQFQTVRHMLSYSPHNSPLLLSPHTSGQSSSQSLPHVQMPTSPPLMPVLRDPPMLHFQNRLPMAQDPGGRPIVHNPCNPPTIFPISTPEGSHPGPSLLTSNSLHNPYTNREAQQPLDLSLLPRQLPSLLPLPPLISTRPTEVRTTARSIPRTHTVTSNVNTVVYFPSTLLPHSSPNTLETEQQSTSIELYSSCAEHLLPPPKRHRARTPTDLLPEHLQYQTWPVDNLGYTDHTEEVDTTECDSWLEGIAPDESISDAGTGPSCAATEPPPVIIIEHDSPASPTASPPRPSLS